MGLGFVLLLWLVVGLGIAALLAGGLTAVAYFACRRREVSPWPWVAAFLAAPFVWLGFAFATFGAYALWCETYRGVDPGIGDGWKVPLGNGYSLQAIDTWDNSFVTAGSGEQVHVGLTLIGQAGEVVFGKEPTGYFVIDTRARSDRLVSSQADLDAYLRRAGGRGCVLQEPSEFYARRRWSFQDLAAAAVVVGAPIIGYFVQIVWFAKVLRARRA